MCFQPANYKCYFVFKREELLVSLCRNTSFFVSAFDTSGGGRPGQGTFAECGYDVNTRIRGVRWQAWNGTSRRRAVRIVQEKVRFHRDYWGTAAGECCSPAGSRGRLTNPFLCSYRWQISSLLCVCVKGESLHIRCVQCLKGRRLNIAFTLACKW